jgi:branched-chain amino acid transport system substrate-binding protein
LIRFIPSTCLAAALMVSLAPSSARATAAHPNEVRIGGTLPLSGPESVSGRYFQEGYEIAVEEANQRGGLDVGGRVLPVQLVVRDDGSDKAKAVDAAEQLISNDEVDFLLGTFNSANVELQSVVAEKHGVPYVSGSGAAAGLFQRKLRFLFGLQSPVKMLASAQMDWIEVQQKAGNLPTPARIALVWEDTAHGQDFRAGVHKFTDRNPDDWTIVLDESFPVNAKDFRPLVARVKHASADLFLADAHLPDYIALHRQYLAAGLCHAVVSYGARGPEKEAADALGAKNVEYVLSAVWWNEQLATNKGLNHTFVERFRKKYGRAPQWQHALGYEAVRAVLAAVESARSTSREKVREALASLQMDSILPSGRLTFPAEYGQQARYSFLVLQNQPGERSPIVYPEYDATAPGLLNPRCARTARVAVPAGAGSANAVRADPLPTNH